MVAWAMLDPSPPPLGNVSDKTVHFLSFFAVSFATIAFCRTPRQFLLAGGFCAVAGVGFETAQYYIPSRAFEWGDIVANLSGTATGILLAGAVMLLIKRRWRLAW